MSKSDILVAGAGPVTRRPAHRPRERGLDRAVVGTMPSVREVAA